MDMQGSSSRMVCPATLRTVWQLSPAMKSAHGTSAGVSCTSAEAFTSRHAAAT